VEDHGAEVIPTWRITTPEGAFLILTRFDMDKPEQRERTLLLIFLQRLRRAAVVTFAPVEWLKPEEVDETYFKILPLGRSEITAEEAHELAVIFGEDGELAAQRLS
jgi:hypothetical protein